MATNVSSLNLYTPKPAAVARRNDDGDVDHCCSPFSCILNYVIFCFIGFSILASLVILNVHKYNRRDNLIPEIGLKSFSVSNLNIIDDRISGDWTIGLNLENPAHKAVVYENIKFTVVLSTVPNVPIVDFHQEHPSVQPPKNRTVVHLHGSTEKLPLNHMTADSMIQDVIDGEIVEFDLFMAAKCKHAPDILGASRVELSCKGIKVLILPSKSAPMNAAGFAEIPVCNLVKRMVKDIPPLGQLNH